MVIDIKFGTAIGIDRNPQRGRVPALLGGLVREVPKEHKCRLPHLLAATGPAIHETTIHPTQKSAQA
jgi:hypothetical protein